MNLLLVVLSIVADWIGKRIGVLSWIPGVVFIVQVFISGFILLATFAGVLFLPGRALKLLSLVIGLGMVICVWFV
jgi:hypothetical protein